MGSYGLIIFTVRQTWSQII
ncbi:hypothetical protein LINPERPRIM_LOCUS26805 [Linum perenne]